jgi:phosphoribosylamine---glycine ligase
LGAFPKLKSQCGLAALWFYERKEAMSKIDVLLVGSGGREHALAWKLRQSERLGKLYVAPGNAGTGLVAENVPIKATDIDTLLAFALEKKIDLTVVGSEDPLSLGITDLFFAKGLPIFGPTKAATQIEASKLFAKNLMTQPRSNVPTADFRVFTEYKSALSFVRKHFDPVFASRIVVKASGLALGKGAYVCRNVEEAEQALDEIMVKRAYGSAGDQVIIEKFVEGQEVSIHAFCDGTSFKLCPSSQDHKPIFDGDEGPNTGGMGAIAPVPWFRGQDYVSKRIVGPVLSGMRAVGSPFVGLLYPGLKIPEAGPQVLEFNARFGDPETQVLMRLLKTDLLTIFEACVEGRLHEVEVEWNPGYAACVVMASGGYPSSNYKKGFPITGIVEAEALSDVKVFQAGTTIKDGILVTSGGRVLAVSAVGETLQRALEKVYCAVPKINFEGAQFRTDIGAKSLQV